MAPVHVDLNNEPYPAPFSVGPLQLVEKSSLNILNLVRFKVALEAITKPYFSQCNFCSLQDAHFRIYEKPIILASTSQLWTILCLLYLQLLFTTLKAWLWLNL